MKATDTPWPVQVYRDPEGRAFHYVPVRHPGASSLVVHFSAFFGDWGDARPYREHFGGYFHRLKMLGGEDGHHWLFLCDAYGAAGNGTYYVGQQGDAFVERAMTVILSDTLADLGLGADRLVTVGSSMGATAALKFGLLQQARGVVAIAPHIELDICADRQNRWREVAWICPDGDPLNPANHPLTRQVSRLVERWTPSRPLPRLFLQSAVDDAGVHDEQARPLVARWADRGGWVAFDERPSGGHTSDWATKPLLLDAFARLLASEPIDLAAYQNDPRYAGVRTPPPWTHRVRRTLSLTRKRILGRR